MIDALGYVMLFISWVFCSLVVKSFCDTKSKYPQKTNLEWMLKDSPRLYRARRLIRLILILFPIIPIGIFVALVLTLGIRELIEHSKKQHRKKRYDKFIRDDH